MTTEIKKSAKPLEGLAKAADHIVGDIVLGTIGRVAFHVCQVPVVGPTFTYIGENLRDGWKAAEQASLRKALANEIVAATKGGRAMSSETIRARAKDLGLSEGALKEVEEIVRRETAPKAPRQIPGPQPVIAA